MSKKQIAIITKANELLEQEILRLRERAVCPPVVFTDDAREAINEIQSELNLFVKIFWRFYWKKK